MKSERTLAKLAGLTMVSVSGVLLPLSSFFIVTGLLSIHVSILEAVGLIFLDLVLLGFLGLGFRLLIYESIRPITLDEIRKRVAKQSNPRKFVYNPIVISLSGIDGGGKSTQLQMLAKNFEERQLAYKYVRLRWACFISYVPLAIYSLLGYAEWKTNPRDKKRYLVYHYDKNAALAKIWPYFFTLDLLVLSFFRTKISILRDYFVLCDRCELDAFVDLVVDTRNYHLVKSLIGKTLLSISQKGRTAFLIDVTEEEAFKRKKDILSINYIKKRRQLYLYLAKVLNMPVLSGNSEPGDAHQQLVKHFLCHCPFWYANIFEK